MGNIADDLVANIRAGQEIFLAGVKSADENSPSARKLARLTQKAQEALDLLEGRAHEGALVGESMVAAARMVLRGALVEAKS